MPKIVVIADDLTGGNGTGVALTKQGLSVHTALWEAGGPPPELSDCDAVIYDALIVPTNSRGLSPEEAYHRVHEAARAFSSDDVFLYSKRIDSTLRGNLGSETDALLDALGDDYIAAVIPCFPAAGRIYVGGYLLVDGVPLYRTAAATDPRNPVKTARAVQLFAAQSKYMSTEIFLEDIAGDKDFLISRIRWMNEQGIRIFLFDAAVHGQYPFYSVESGGAVVAKA